ncbi:MAG: nucleoside hydrolase [Candidatus Helarchaeota archaeon]
MLKCIIDCDPGIDDALALIFASKLKNIEIMAITTTYGNNSVENTSSNALKIIELIKMTNIPVAKGFSSPIIKDFRMPKFNYSDPKSNPHGPTGLGNANLGTPNTKLSNLHAIDLISQIILEYPNKISLISLGPLTNIAILFLKYPNIIDYIKELTIMGGAINIGGNITPYSEFNIWSDAEAAKIVFNYGKSKIILVPLDVTRQIIFSDIEIFNKNDKYHQFLYDILKFYNKFHEPILGFSGSFLHDPFAIGVASDHTLCKIHKTSLDVEIENLDEYGRTFIPFEKKNENTELNVCTAIDADQIKKFLKLFSTRLLNH